MKKIVYTLGLVIVSTFVICNSAFASLVPPLYTSDTTGGGMVSDFGLTDNIYLSAKNDILLSFLAPDATTKYWGVFNNYFSTKYPDYVNPKATDGWYTLNDLKFVNLKLTGFQNLNWGSIQNYSWDNIKVEGQWTVTANKFWCNTDSWQFNLSNPVPPSTVPEPISSTLFLLGAGALGIKAYRRKKKVS